ncbi:MAG: S8 family serine peptidase [Rhodospirillaceae bacterium]|nr:S8 family serine peptidase [Rhodospirillaceae bacterium]
MIVRSAITAVMFLFVLLASAATARADAVKIGMIDFALAPEALDDFAGVTVRSVTFAATDYRPARFQSAAFRRGHAETMAAALVETFQDAAPGVELELFVASPFLQNADTGAQSIDLEELEFAYAWLARQGVTIVAQTFVGRDTPLLRAAMAAAADHGLVLLTSAGNGPGQNVVPPYPASYAQAIGISTTALRADLDGEADRNTYVRYSVPAPAMSSIKLRGDPELAALYGSSRATVVAAGLLGALSTRYRIEDRDDALLLLDSHAVPVSDYAGGGAYGVGVLVPDAVADMIKSPLAPPPVRCLLRGERATAALGVIPDRPATG